MQCLCNGCELYLGQAVGMCHRLLTPRKAGKQQDWEEEVVLCPHKHPMRGVGQGLQHLYTPGYEWQCVNVWVQCGLAVMIKLVGSCVVRVVLGFPPCWAEPLQVLYTASSKLYTAAFHLASICLVSS